MSEVLGEIPAAFYSGVTSNITSGNCTIVACDERIVIFYSRSSCATSTLTLAGGNLMDINGIVYAPCTAVKFAGQSGR